MKVNLWYYTITVKTNSTKRSDGGIVYCTYERIK